MQSLNQHLAPFDVDVSSARISDLRKLYHQGWDDVLRDLVPAEDHDWINQKYRKLVF